MFQFTDWAALCGGFPEGLLLPDELVQFFELFFFLTLFGIKEKRHFFAEHGEQEFIIVLQYPLHMKLLPCSSDVRNQPL